MADLTYDPDAPGYMSPGLRAPVQQQPLGMRVPTPAGWLPWGGLGNAAADLAGSLVPSRQGLAQALGSPMDGMAWAARKLGVKGIPGEYGQPDFAQRAGGGDKLVWQPSADVPFSSANLQRMMDNPPDLSALLRHALARPGRF
jgi:hypothetical protein